MANNQDNQRWKEQEGEKNDKHTTNILFNNTNNIWTLSKLFSLMLVSDQQQIDLKI